MCLRFVFLLITRLTSWLQLSQREETWKTAEILILRHQLAVGQRRQPPMARLLPGPPGRPLAGWVDRHGYQFSVPLVASRALAWARLTVAAVTCLGSARNVDQMT